MHIGIEVTAAVTQGGGIGRYVRELLRALAAAQSDAQFKLFYAAKKPAFALPPLPANFSVRQLPFHDIWLARAWHRLRLPIPVQSVTGPVAVYHSPDFTLPPVAGRTPSVLTVHDLSFERDPESAAPSLRRYLQAVVPRSVAQATHVLADSQATRDDILALYSPPPEKVSVLYPGVAARFAPVTDAAALAAVRVKYGLGSGPFVLAVSTLQPRKNFARLIAAFDLAFGNHDVRLVIAGGKGWLYDSIFAEVQQRQLHERVLFPGFVADADLPVLYSAADGVAYPSLYEGFGLPLLEAMGCGTPVLTSTVSCLPEVAGDAAILVDPYNVEALAAGLQQLLGDSDLRKKLRALGLQRAQNFQWSAAAAQLLGLYAQLAAEQ